MDSDSERNKKLERGKRQLEKFRRDRERKRKKKSAASSGGAQSSDGQAPSDAGSEISLGTESSGQVEMPHPAEGEDSEPTAAGVGHGHAAGDQVSGEGDAEPQDPGASVSAGDLASDSQLNTSHSISSIPTDSDVLDDSGSVAGGGGGGSGFEEDFHARVDDILNKQSTDSSQLEHYGDHTSEVPDGRAAAEAAGDMQLELESALQRLRVAEQERDKLLLRERAQVAAPAAAAAAAASHQAGMDALQQAHAAELEDVRHDTNEVQLAQLASQWQAERDNLEREIAHLQEANAETQRTRDDLLHEKVNLELSVATGERERLELRAELDAARSEWNAARNDYEAKLTSLNRETSERDETHAVQLQDAATQVAALQVGNQRLEASVIALQQSVEAARTGSDALDRELVAARQENESLVARIQQQDASSTASARFAESEASQRYESQLCALQEERSAAVAELEEQLRSAHDSRLAGDEQHSRELQALHGDRDSLQEANDHLQRQVSELQALHGDRDSLQEANDHLQRQVSELQALHGDRDSLQEANDHLQHQVSELQAVASRQQSDQQHVTALMAERERLSARVDDLTEQCRHAAMSEQSVAEQHKSALAALGGEKESLEELVARLRDETERAAAERAELHGRLEQSKLAEDRLQVMADEKSQLLEEMTGGLLSDVADSDELQRLADKLSEVAAENDGLRRTAEASEDASHELQRASTAHILAAEDRQREAESELALVRSQLAEEVQEKNAVVERLCTATADGHDLAAQVADLQRHRDAGREQLAERDAALQRLQRDLASAGAALAAVKQREQELADAVRSSQAQTDALRGESVVALSQLRAEKETLLASHTSLNESHAQELRAVGEQHAGERDEQLQYARHQHEQSLQTLRDQLSSAAGAATSDLVLGHERECERLEAGWRDEQERCRQLEERTTSVSEQLERRTQALADFALLLGMDAEQAAAAARPTDADDTSLLRSHTAGVVDTVTRLRHSLAGALRLVGASDAQASRPGEESTCLESIRDRLQQRDAEHLAAEQHLRQELERALEHGRQVQAGMEDQHRVAVASADARLRELQAELSSERGAVGILQEQEIAEVERVRRECDASLQLTVAAHRQEVATLGAGHAADVQRLSADHGEALAQQQQQHDSAAEQLKLSHAAELQELSAENVRRLTTLEEVSRGSNEQLQQVIERVQAEHLAREQAMVEGHARELEESERRFDEDQAAKVAALRRDLEEEHRRATARLEDILSTERAAQESLASEVQELQENFVRRLQAAKQQSADELEATKNELAAAMAAKDLLYSKEIETLQRDLDTQLDGHDATMALDTQRDLLEGEKLAAVEQAQLQLLQLRDEHGTELAALGRSLDEEREQLRRTISDLEAAVHEQRELCHQTDESLKAAVRDLEAKSLEIVALASSVDELRANYEREVATVRGECTHLLGLQSNAREAELVHQYEQALAELRAGLERNHESAVKELKVRVAAEREAEVRMETEHALQKLRQESSLALEQLRSNLEEQNTACVEDAKLKIAAAREAELEAVRTVFEEQRSAADDSHASAVAEQANRLRGFMVGKAVACVQCVRSDDTWQDDDELWTGLVDNLRRWKADMDDKRRLSLDELNNNVLRDVDSLDADEPLQLEGRPPYVTRLAQWQGKIQADRQQLSSLAAQVNELNNDVLRDVDSLGAEEPLRTEGRPAYVARLAQWQERLQAERQHLASLTAEVSGFERHVGELAAQHTLEQEQALDQQRGVLIAEYMQKFEEMTAQLEEGHRLKLDREVAECNDKWQERVRAAMVDQRRTLEAEFDETTASRLAAEQSKHEQELRSKLGLNLAQQRDQYEAKLAASLAAQAEQHSAIDDMHEQLRAAVARCEELGDSLQRSERQSEAALGALRAEHEQAVAQFAAAAESRHNRELELARTRLLEEKAEALRDAVQRTRDQVSQPLQEQLAAVQADRASLEEQLAGARQQLKEAQALHQKFVTGHLALAITEAEKWQESCKTALVEREEARSTGAVLQRSCDEQALRIDGLERQVAGLKSGVERLRESGAERDSRRNSEIEEVSNLLRLVESDKHGLDAQVSSLTGANRQLMTVLASLAGSVTKSNDLLTAHRRRLHLFSAGREPLDEEHPQQQQVMIKVPADTLPVSRPVSSQVEAIVSLGESFAAAAAANTASARETLVQSTPLMSSTMREDVVAAATTAAAVGGGGAPFGHTHAQAYTVVSSSCSSQATMRGMSTTVDSGLGGGMATSASGASMSAADTLDYAPRTATAAYQPRVDGSVVRSPGSGSDDDDDDDADDKELHSHTLTGDGDDPSVLPLSFSSLPPSQMNFSFELYDNAGDGGLDGGGGGGGVGNALANAVEQLWLPAGAGAGGDDELTARSLNVSGDLSQYFNESVFEGPELDHASSSLLCHVGEDLFTALQPVLAMHGHQWMAQHGMQLQAEQQAEERAQQLAEQCAELQQRLAAAARDAAECRAECQRTVAELSDRQAEKAGALETELGDVRAQLQDAFAEREVVLEERNALSAAKTEIEEKCRDALCDNDDAARRFSLQHQTLTAEIASLQERLAALDIQNSELSGQVAATTQEVAAAALWRDRLVLASSENDELRQRLDEHLEHLGALESAGDKIRDLENMHSVSQQGQLQLQARLADAAHQVASLSQQLDAEVTERSEALQRSDELQRQVDLLVDQLGSLQATDDSAGAAATSADVRARSGDSISDDSLSNISELSGESGRQRLASVGHEAAQSLRNVVAASLDDWASELGALFAPEQDIPGRIVVLRCAVADVSTALATQNDRLADELNSLRKQLESHIVALQRDKSGLTESVAQGTTRISDLERTVARKTDELARVEERLLAASDRNESSFRELEDREAQSAEDLQKSLHRQYQQQLNSNLAGVQEEHHEQMQALKASHVDLVDELVKQHALEVETLSRSLLDDGAFHDDDDSESTAASDDISDLLARAGDDAQVSPESPGSLRHVAQQLRSNSQSVLALSEGLQRLDCEDCSVAEQLRKERDSLQATVATLQQLLVRQSAAGHGDDGDSLRRDIIDALQRMFAQQRDLLASHAGQGTSEALLRQQGMWETERALLHAEIQQLQRSLEELRRESQQHAAELGEKLALGQTRSADLDAVEQLRAQLNDALRQVSDLQALLSEEKLAGESVTGGLRSALVLSQAESRGLDERLADTVRSQAQAALQLRTEQQRVAELHRALAEVRDEAARATATAGTHDDALRLALQEQSQRLDELRATSGEREAALEAEAARLKEEIPRLQHSLELSVGSERERGEQLLAQEAAGAAELRRLLQEERRSSLSTAQRRDSEQDEVRRLALQLQSAEQQHRDLQVQLRSEQAAVVQANEAALGLKDRCLRLDGDAANQQRLVEQLQAQLAEKSSLCRALEARLHESERRVLDGSGNERAQRQLQSALRAVQDQVAELGAQLDAEQRTVAELRTQEQLHSATFASLQHDKDRLEAQIDGLRRQLKTAGDALATRPSRSSPSAAGDECFHCKVAVPRLERQHGEMAQLAERLSQERGRLQDELNQAVDKERRVRRDLQQLRAAVQVTEQRAAAEQASWQTERSALVRQATDVQASHPGGDRDDLAKNFARAERFRRELSFQKQYLMTLLCGFSDCEDAVLRRVGVSLTGARWWHSSPATASRHGSASTKKISRFLVVARCVVAVFRMKRFVRSPPVPRPLPSQVMKRASRLLAKSSSSAADQSSGANGRRHHRHRSSTGRLAAAAKAPATLAPLPPAVPRLGAVVADTVSEAESSQSDAAFLAHVQRLNRLQDRLNSVSVPAVNPPRRYL